MTTIADVGLPPGAEPVSVESHGSARNVPGRSRWRGIATPFGPAFIVSVAYVDPGNFSTNFAAGALYGYKLVWVVVLANLMAMPMQYLSAKIGIVTGRSVPELCRERCPRLIRVGLWVQAEIVVMATDLAEFIGGAIGLNLMFGLAPLPAGLITAAASFAMLAVRTRGARTFEQLISFALLMIFAGFAYQLLCAGNDPSAAAQGLLPTLPDSGALYLSAGVLGATMMPHAVYLHSSLTSERGSNATDLERRRSLHRERWDVIVALGVAGLMNLTMLLVAARVFAGIPAAAHSLNAIHDGLARMVGGSAAIAFAGALLVSGLSSSGVGTLAGQSVMAGFVNVRMSALLRRSITMTPALVVLSTNMSATDVLTFSQVVLSFGIPFALVPLIMIGRSTAIMGNFVNRQATTAVAVAIAIVVVGLNVTLVCSS